MPNRLLTVLLLFVFFNGAAQTAPQIIEKYLNFLGGEQRLAAIHSRIDSGTYNYGGIEFPFVSYAKAPDRYQYTVSFKGKYFAQAYDGMEGWKIDVFKGEKNKTILHGKAALAMANEADVHLESPFIDYQKKGYQATVTGMDTIDQRICVRISLQSASDTALYSFDRSTGELVKKTAISKNAELNNALLDTYFTDYTEVEGIRIPFKTVHKIKDQVVLTVTIKKCDLNRPIPDSMFQTTLAHSGAAWHYNNAASHLLSVIITKATKMDTRAFADKYLFGPLGITHYEWAKMKDGYYDGSGLLSIRMRSLDMLKKGTAITYGMGWGGQFLVIYDQLRR